MTVAELVVAKLEGRVATVTGWGIKSGMTFACPLCGKRQWAPGHAEGFRNCIQCWEQILVPAPSGMPPWE